MEEWRSSGQSRDLVAPEGRRFPLSPLAGPDLRRRRYPCLQERLVGTNIGKCLMLFFSSNGWDGVTAALQLVSHLEGNALNVALPVPAPRRVLPGVLLDALTEHYSSPG